MKTPISVYYNSTDSSFMLVYLHDRDIRYIILESKHTASAYLDFVAAAILEDEKYTFMGML